MNFFDPDSDPTRLPPAEPFRLPADERQLAALFRALPERRPRTGFADRVLARLASPSLFARPAVRALLAAAGVVVALSAALLLPAAGFLATRVGPAGAIGFVTGSFAELAVRFASGLAFWEPLAVTARAFARALGEPRLIALLLAHFLIATAALRGLVALSTASRRTRHVAS
ncbi:MAG: hypothetical protein F9K18_07995 [Thermoanaerobaculia bacterium]|nr:MAG: hypothetical protein F9K18_07995 [Thermoanaerobaculia bacterium]MBZ0100537.1 hypothetical protein [Thermoanaerobaculia bacterium]